jgi:mono/diheme cytochrome c family protein
MLLQACYYDVGEELYPGGCDTSEMSYASDVVAILTNNQCIACHSAVSPGGSVRLDDYTNVKIYVDNGRLLGSIKHDFGFSPMPKGQTNKIAPCDIDQIRSWIDAGALDN